MLTPVKRAMNVEMSTASVAQASLRLSVAVAPMAAESIFLLTRWL